MRPASRREPRPRPGARSASRPRPTSPPRSRRSSRSSTPRRSSSSTASRTSTTRPVRRRCSPTSVRRRADRHPRSRSARAAARPSPSWSSASASTGRALFAPRRGAWGSRSQPPGTHPWAELPRPAHHRHARTTSACSGELGWVAQRNNTWSLHVHVGRARRRPGDRGLRPAARASCRRCWRVSANSPFLDEPRHRPALGPHARSSPAPSRAAGSTSRSATGTTYAGFVDLLSGPTRSSSRRSSGGASGPHHSFGTVEVRICDAQTRRRGVVCARRR